MTNERLAETPEELAAIVRAIIPFDRENAPEEHAALDSILARLDAATKLEDEADGWRMYWLDRAHTAEADAENLAQAAQEFVATTSYYRQPKASRAEFERLAVILHGRRAALAARSKP